MIDAEEPFFFAEVGVAGKLKKLASSPAGDKLYTRLMEARKSSGNESLSVDIEAIQRKTHMEYDDIQAAAIRTAATAKVMVLTGGPGTGKTTTTHGIISAYKAYGLKILLATPTGRAAKRMTEATGLEAKTMEGNTEYAVQKIAEACGFDTLRLLPVKKYPDSYDRIVFGFPVWAGNVTPPIRTLKYFLPMDISEIV